MSLRKDMQLSTLCRGWAETQKLNNLPKVKMTVSGRTKMLNHDSETRERIFPTVLPLRKL